MNPTFGDKVEGAHYQTRYGVYAVIPNQEKTKIILVQAPLGAWTKIIFVFSWLGITA